MSNLIIFLWVENLNWDLGDFGLYNERVWSFTKVFNLHSIPSTTTVISAMDLVLLCVTIAFELKKDDWKQFTWKPTERSKRMSSLKS